MLFFGGLIFLWAFPLSSRVLAVCLDSERPSCGSCTCYVPWRAGSCAPNYDPDYAGCDGYCTERDPQTGVCLSWDTHWVCGCGGGSGPGPTSVCSLVTAPTNLVPNGTVNPGPLTLTWNSVTGADHYVLRIDDLTNGWTGSCLSLNPGDTCVDNANGTSFNFVVKAGRRYHWWVHAANSCGNWSDAAEAYIDVRSATCVSNNILTTITAGSTFPVSIIVKNNGSNTWNKDNPNRYLLGSQNPQDNTVWGTERVGLTNNVSAGNNHTFTFQQTAPQTAGTYPNQWQMLQEGITWFGEVCGPSSVTVVVEGPPTVVFTGYPNTYLQNSIHWTNTKDDGLWNWSKRVTEFRVSDQTGVASIKQWWSNEPEPGDEGWKAASGNPAEVNGWMAIPRNSLSGDLQAKIRAKDTLGNISGVFTSERIRLDIDPPECETITISPNPVPPGNRVGVYGGGNDLPTGRLIGMMGDTSFSIKPYGGSWSSVCDYHGGPPFSIGLPNQRYAVTCNFPAPAETGTYSVQVETVDFVGNQRACPTQSLQVENPSCAVALSMSNPILEVGQTANLTASVSNIQFATGISSVTFSSSNTAIVTVSPTADNSLPYNTTANTAGVGSVAITAKVYLTPGNILGCSSSIPVAVTPLGPWFQAQGGDIHSGAEIRSRIPSNILDKNFSRNLEGIPGLVSYNFPNSPDFGSGTVSSFGWLIKAEYLPARTDYSYFYQKAGRPAVDNFSCDTGCPLPPIGKTTIYYSADKVIMGNDWLIPANTKVIVLINNDLEIDKSVIVPVGSFLAFIVKGNIDISGEVEGVEGVYLAGGTIDTYFDRGAGDGNGSRLTGTGVFYAKEGINLNRNNQTHPSELFVFRPDLVINAPRELFHSVVFWQEVVP